MVLGSGKGEECCFLCCLIQSAGSHVRWSYYVQAREHIETRQRTKVHSKAVVNAVERIYPRGSHCLQRIFGGKAGF